jgi:hypothetical protein
MWLIVAASGDDRIHGDAEKSVSNAWRRGRIRRSAAE